MQQIYASVGGVLNSSISLPQGQQGFQGHIGDEGRQGPRGVPGPPGSDGLNGRKGADVSLSLILHGQ